MNKIAKFIIPLFVVLVGVLLVTLFVLALKFRDTSTVTNTTVSNTQETWQIYKITPLETIFNVTLKSSTGRIREYSDLNSFGLSQDGQYLAFYKEKQLNFTKLSEDINSKVIINLENIKISFGESINWDLANNYFATTLIDMGSNKTYVLLANTQNLQTKLISASIPYNANSIENAYFSPIGKNILVRTYKSADSEYPKEDGNLPTLYELPAYLTVYNIDGQEINSLKISDYSTSTLYVDYKFDLIGRVKYYSSQNPIDTYIIDSKYIKVSL